MYDSIIWRPLPLDPSHGLPVLLAAVSTGPSSYTIRLTDMANLWMERSDRGAICRKAVEEKTSIDPSDTPENMARVLSSLRSALDPSQPGHDQTRLTLLPGCANDTKDTKDTGDTGDTWKGDLIIKVICQIPGIQPLVWPIYLKRAPPSSLATDLVLPLMEGQFDRKLEVESLIQSLNHKDVIIAKLTDKLEAMGSGLELVFPGLSRKRKLTKSLAEEKIKELAPFDKRRWTASLKGPENRPPDVARLVRSVLDGDGFRSESVMEVDASPNLDEWWHDFRPAASRPGGRASQTAGAPAQMTPSLSSTDSASAHDDFEVQTTPPTHLRSGEHEHDSKTTRAPATLRDDDDDDSTADEDDHHQSVTATLSQRSKDSRTTTPARMGLVGGKGGGNKGPAPRSTMASAAGSWHTKAPVQDLDDEEDTASGTETGSVQDDVVAATPPSQAPVHPPRAGEGDEEAPKKRGLGRIGGMATKSEPAGTDGAASSSDAPPPRRKLGVIGKIGGSTSFSPRAVAETAAAAAAAADAASTGGVERSRVAVRRAQETQAVEESRARETSEEQATRRREELRMELQKKAAAGPAKKKRRF